MELLSEVDEDEAAKRSGAVTQNDHQRAVIVEENLAEGAYNACIRMRFCIQLLSCRLLHRILQAS